MVVILMTIMITVMPVLVGVTILIIVIQGIVVM